MAQLLLGKKKGMTQVFDESGNLIPCTVIEIETNVVVQVKEDAKDGYKAVQLGAGSLTPTQKKRLSKAVLGHYKKNEVEPRGRIKEMRVEDDAEYTVGQEITLAQFEGVRFIDVMGVSKGKGFQGVMKRYNFGGLCASHGVSLSHRAPGSTGMRSSPGRTFKGKKMPGRMGGDNLTVDNLKVVKIDLENQCILVRGAVPGANGAKVCISPARKKK